MWQRLCLLLPAVAAALRTPTSRLRGPVARRQALALGALAALPASAPGSASAADDELADVYFGCGCFWHVQHEFVEAERRVLGRKDGEVTARAGYAGGNAGADRGKVCYHNAGFVADYGKLGHAEVVRLTVPTSSFGEFAREYCRLFNKDGYRPDQLGDTGPEYRNLVGLPGGAKSPLAKELVRASVAEGDRLDFGVGKGDDADVRGLSWIMDTAAFPFFQAEPYHQFHDGFAWGEDYPGAYNGLAKALRVADSGCPNGMLGVGVLGL